MGHAYYTGSAQPSEDAIYVMFYDLETKSNQLIATLLVDPQGNIVIGAFNSASDHLVPWDDDLKKFILAQQVGIVKAMEKHDLEEWCNDVMAQLDDAKNRRRWGVRRKISLQLLESFRRSHLLIIKPLLNDDPSGPPKEDTYV